MYEKKPLDYQVTSLIQLIDQTREILNRTFSTPPHRVMENLTQVSENLSQLNDQITQIEDK
ncbi:MAG: hypothetical protein KAS38_07960, partial [Anaerolineales bacterium]|nr:hypothetical protein [Anaerolineales bacterium]